MEGSEGSVKDTLQAYGSGAIHIMRSVRGAADTARGACGAILTCPDRVSRYGARRRRTQQAGAAPYGLGAALLKGQTRSAFGIRNTWGFSAKTEAPQPPDTHNHMELLARPPGGGSGHGDADGGGTRGGDTRGRGGAWAAERAVAAVLAAAAGGGGWRRHCWRQPCGGGAAVAARRRRCSALPQQARPDSTGSLPARPAHSNAPAAPADCWMATVAKVGEVRAAPWQRWPGGPSRCATATALRSRASPCCRLDERDICRDFQ